MRVVSLLPACAAVALLTSVPLHAAPPGTVLALGDGNPETPSGIPLLEGRGLVNGAPAAYVCRQFTCQAPVTTPGQLVAALTTPA